MSYIYTSMQVVRDPLATSVLLITLFYLNTLGQTKERFSFLFSYVEYQLYEYVVFRLVGFLPIFRVVKVSCYCYLFCGKSREVYMYI